VARFYFVMGTKDYKNKNKTKDNKKNKSQEMQA
jgi:hypothetical protein